MKCNSCLSRRDALKILGALGLGAETASQTATAQDPVRVNPRSYHVVFENEKVRVIEYKARPGLGICGTGVHSHPDHVTVMLTAGKARVMPKDGKSFIGEYEAGFTFWDPATTHTVENMTGSGQRAIQVEIKDKDWRPSTG